MPCYEPPTGQRRSPTTRLVRWAVLHLPAVVLTQPWALFVKLAAAAGGGLVLLGFVPEPPSVAHQLPGPLKHLWALLLCAGGILGLVGLLRGLWRIECAGLLFLAAAALAYAVLLWRNFGWDGTVPAAAFAGLAAAALLRALGVASAHLLAEHRLADGELGVAGQGT